MYVALLFQESDAFVEVTCIPLSDEPNTTPKDNKVLRWLDTRSPNCFSET